MGLGRSTLVFLLLQALGFGDSHVPTFWLILPRAHVDDELPGPEQLLQGPPTDFLILALASLVGTIKLGLHIPGLLEERTIEWFGLHTGENVTA